MVISSINVRLFLIGITGYILGFLSKFADEYIKEYFDKRKRKSEHKRWIGEEILKICNEASTNSFRNSPRKIEHINKVLTEIELLDKKMEAIMNKFVSSWYSYATRKKAGNLSSDEVRFAKEQLDRAEESRKILIKMANKMR